MRIGCLQFAPQVGDVSNNLNRADAVLSKANPESLDILVLPELAFSGESNASRCSIAILTLDSTGYNFKSLKQISPFLEPSGSGISSLWARTNALKYDCTIVVGYPEKADVSEKWPTSPEYYNSAIMVNPDGETIANYRKTFLFYTDETWALEGEGFFGGWLPGLGQTAMGICMDVNPYQFQAPWSAFEFAYHILDIEANLVIISLAWMTREDQRTFSRTPKEPDMDTLIYWLSRLEPVIRSDNEDEIIVVFCNRTGVEDDAVYAGTSTILGIKQGEVNVYGILSRGDKELLAIDTEKPPFGRLVYREENSGNEFQPGKMVLTDPHSKPPSDTLLKTPALPEKSWKSVKGHDNHNIETPVTAIHMHSSKNLGRSQHDVLPNKPRSRPTEYQQAGFARASSQTPSTPGRIQNDLVPAESLLDQPNPLMSSPSIAPCPASRQTSRPRASSRPGSAMSHKMYLPSVNKRLESLSREPGSATQRRQPAQESNPSLRPNSRKSRNTSRSRAEAEPAISPHLADLAWSSILTAASPNIYESGVSSSKSSSIHRDAVDTLQALADSQHGSFSHHPGSTIEKYQQQRFQADRTLESPYGPVNFGDPDDRTISRGRQRERRYYYPEERSHSGDSTFPEVSRSRFPSPEPPPRDDNFVAVEGKLSADCSVHGAHHQPGTITIDGIAPTEGHVSANCPVHSSHSRIRSNRTRTESTQRRQSSTQRGLRHSSHAGRKSARCEGDRRDLTQRGTSHPQESTHRRDSGRGRESAQERPHAEQAQPRVPPQVQPNSSSKTGLVYSNSVETVTNLAGSETPQLEPSTPKAMTLLPEM